MTELSKERLEQILHHETVKKEEPDTILRSIYTRYMYLYEQYFADISALDDNRIAELRKYHDETRSLVRYYYMDIPQDICAGIREFENKYSDGLLGPGWYETLYGSYEDFRRIYCYEEQSEESVKAAFQKQALTVFYDAMDYIFREGFGTESQTFKDVASRITGLLFGKD